MNGYLSVTNWGKYQHYKNRRPPWVKFYTDLLDPESKLNELPVTTRFLFDRMLLLAANYDNRVPNDSELLAKLLRMRPRAVREGITQLTKGRYLSQTRTRRGASKGASKHASRLLAPESETEGETTTNQRNGSLSKNEARDVAQEATIEEQDEIPF